MHQRLLSKTLVTSISPQEQWQLRLILPYPEWDVQLVPGLGELRRAVRDSSCRVALTDTRLPDGHTWKDVLDEFGGFTEGPLLIVADRLADEALWAEVLNLGGYDLLNTPFEPAEVQRVVQLAWEFHLRQTERLRISKKAAEGPRRREETRISHCPLAAP